MFVGCQRKKDQRPTKKDQRPTHILAGSATSIGGGQSVGRQTSVGWSSGHFMESLLASTFFLKGLRRSGLQSYTGARPGHNLLVAHYRESHILMDDEERVDLSVIRA